MSQKLEEEKEGGEIWLKTSHSDPRGLNSPVVVEVELSKDSVVGLDWLPTFFQLQPVQSFVSSDIEAVQNGDASRTAASRKNVLSLLHAPLRHLPRPSPPIPERMLGVQDTNDKFLENRMKFEGVNEAVAAGVFVVELFEKLRFRLGHG